MNIEHHEDRDVIVSDSGEVLCELPEGERYKLRFILQSDGFYRLGFLEPTPLGDQFVYGPRNPWPIRCYGD